MSTLVNTSSIIVNDRQRKELRNIEDLAASIARIGQINPIVITREYVLVAGERRLRAMQHLEQPKIKATFVDELSPLELHLIELDENIQREDLTWQEECEAVKRYHELSRELNGGEWTQTDTAKALGRTQGYVQQRLLVANEAHNPIVAKADKFSTAFGAATRAVERRKANVVEVLSGPAKTAPSKLDLIDEDIPPPHKPSGPVLNESFLEWAPTYSGPKFNLLHCDFPYGINFNKMPQTANQFDKSYDDSPEVYRTLLDAFIKNLDNFCAESAHLVFWLSMDYYTETIERFRRDTNFTILNFPLVWTKGNTGVIPDPARQPRRTYEVALFGHRGDRKIVQAVSNSYSASPAGGLHPSRKDPEMLRHFLRMLVDNNSRVFDPTAGSGTALRISRELGAQEILGLELDADFCLEANRYINGED